MNLIRKYSFLALLGAVVACHQPEEPVKVLPLADFFKNPEKTSFRLSPDGKYVAFLQPYKNRLNVFIQELATQKITQITTDTLRNIGFCFWATNDMLLYIKDSKGDENYRLFGVNKDGSNLKDITPYDSVKFNTFNKFRLASGKILIGMNHRVKSVFDLYTIDVVTGESKLIQENPGNIVSWILDSKDQVRSAIATDGINEKILYRDKETDTFRTILSFNFKEGMHPFAFSADNQYLYCISNIGRDKSAIVKFDPKTSRETGVIYQNADYDVDDLMISKKDNRVLFASYTDWKYRLQFVDTATKTWFEKLSQKLPDYGLKIVDRDDDEDRFLIRTFSDRSLGSYYLYEVSSDQLTKLSDVSPWLKEEDLATVKPITYKSRDGLTINGYLTLPKGKEAKNLPVIVFPNAQTAFRANWNFSPEVQFFANRGYAVLQMNCRGSAGYGKKFYEAGFKQLGRKIQDDITDGALWLVSEGIADSSRLAIYGFSNGGYAALNGLVKTPDLYRCAVDYSGRTNLFTFIKEIPPYYKPFLNMMYEIVGNPETDADYFKEVSPAFHVDEIKRPLLIAQGKQDPHINISEINTLVKDLKKRGIEVHYMLKENEGHGFRNEENKMEFFREVELFLAKNLQAQP